MDEIINIDMIDEVERCFLNYAYYVNTSRAIPDICGTKPINIRILYSAFESNLTSDKPYKKAGKLIGETMKLSQHGDASIYEALVRMGQEWKMRYPLIDIQGNKGSIDGDPPASARYLETRLAPIASEMLRDIKKNVVDFKLNYSDDEYEPCILPSRFPNLLVNGSCGIGVSISSNWASHNLIEAIDAVIAQINNENITTEELINILPAPDFPTGGTIINQNDMLNIYKTGKGRIKIRGKYKVEKLEKGKNLLVFYEIPYGIKKEELIMSIVKLVEEKTIEGITNILDGSCQKDGMRIEIELKKDIDPDIIANQLFIHSKLEDSFYVNQVAIIDKKPILLNLKQTLYYYIKHQKQVITRRTTFDLEKIENRLHIIAGLLIALENIDNVIKLIKSSKTVKEAIENLINKYNLTEIQAKAIVELKLRKLCNLEKIELENENSELLGQADELNAILSNPQKLNEVLISELEEIKKKYGDARRTELTNIIVKKEEQIKETIKSEDVVVIINNNNEIRRVAKSSYKVQNRNGKGTKNQNIITNVIRTNTIEDLMVFTNKNKVYKLLVNDIPNGTKGDKIANLIKLENNEKVLAIAPISEEKEYIVFITKLGMIKKSYVKEYANIKKNGVIALKLKENDSLKEILFINNESLIIVSKNGKGIKFKTEDIRPIGRSAIGVKGINLDDKDEVVSCSIINNEEDYVAVFAESGNGKRVKLSELVYQVRGGKGNLISKDTVATIAIVKQEDNLLVVGETNSICIKANDIPVANRLALGAKLIKDNGIISVAKL